MYRVAVMGPVTVACGSAGLGAEFRHLINKGEMLAICVLRDIRIVGTVVQRATGHILLHELFTDHQERWKQPEHRHRLKICGIIVLSDIHSICGSKGSDCKGYSKEWQLPSHILVQQGL